MTNYIVVITKEGFMTAKKPDEVLKSDNVLFEGSEIECNNFIHSIR